MRAHWPCFRVVLQRDLESQSSTFLFAFFPRCQSVRGGECDTGAPLERIRHNE